MAYTNLTEQTASLRAARKRNKELEIEIIKETKKRIDAYRSIHALEEENKRLKFEIKGMERDINVRDSDIEDLKRDLSKP